MLGGEVVSEKERNIEYRGRIKIYTDVKEITKGNVINVLTAAMIKHEQNRTQIRNLINFEKGDQPLVREKKVRRDIDIKSISNLAHQITEFWLGYFWGNHMAFVQKSDKHPKGSNPTDSDSAITLLNEMYDAEDMESNLEPYLDDVELVVVGGESDRDARPLDYDWVLDIREQCIRQQVDFEFRQCGTHFIKDGRQYKLQTKDLCKQARLANINYKRTNK